MEEHKAGAWGLVPDLPRPNPFWQRRPRGKPGCWAGLGFPGVRSEGGPSGSTYISPCREGLLGPRRKLCRESWAARAAPHIQQLHPLAHTPTCSLAHAHSHSTQRCTHTVKEQGAFLLPSQMAAEEAGAGDPVTQRVRPGSERATLGSRPRRLPLAPAFLFSCPVCLLSRRGDTPRDLWMRSEADRSPEVVLSGQDGGG